MLHGYLVGGCTTTQNDVSQWRHVTKICASKVDYPSNRGVWPSVFSGKKYRKTFYAILSILGFDPACFREKNSKNSILIRFWKFVKSGVWPSVFSGKKFRMSDFFSWKHAGSNPRNQKNKNLLSTSSWFLRGIFFLKTRWVKPRKSFFWKVSGIFFLKTRWVKPRNSGFFFPDLPIGVNRSLFFYHGSAIIWTWVVCKIYKHWENS